MKFLPIALLALIGFATAAVLPDSATQGPNPQDIATPEPEYIDIDLPEPPRPAAPAPAPVQQRIAPQPRPVQRPVSYAQPAPVQRQYYAPQQPYVQYQQPQQQVQVPGHTFNSQTGYQYRRPVYVRRTYRRRY